MEEQSKYDRFRQEQRRLSLQAARAKREFNQVTGLRLPMSAQFFEQYWPVALKALRERIDADKAGDEPRQAP